MASRPRRAPTSPSPAEPYGRQVQNPGGPVTEEDRADARALLWPVSGTGYERHAALSENRMHDHTAPTYDPNRIVRVLSALRDILSGEIGDWTYSRSSRSANEKRWEEFLVSDRCARCTLSCHTCREWADALGYERVEHDNGRSTWCRPDEQPAR
ncbi:MULTISPECIES: hypothetical protein [unclassified Frankia]|uniref:hypothetical protein n=1 Tax=unclassified Frankia TaxID=2632575 RepID=UPI002AD2CC17|nr:MULTISPECIES: hypothetical protein [unclassified Frankia]